MKRHVFDTQYQEIPMTQRNKFKFKFTEFIVRVVPFTLMQQPSIIYEVINFDKTVSWLCHHCPRRFMTWWKNNKRKKGHELMGFLCVLSSARIFQAYFAMGIFCAFAIRPSHRWLSGKWKIQCLSLCFSCEEINESRHKLFSSVSWPTFVFNFFHRTGRLISFYDIFTIKQSFKSQKKCLIKSNNTGVWLFFLSFSVTGKWVHLRWRTRWCKYRFHLRNCFWNRFIFTFQGYPEIRTMNLHRGG